MENRIDDEQFRRKPPKQAFYYFPEKEDTINENSNDPIKTRRIVFDGNLEYTQFEKNKVKELKDEISNYNKTSIDINYQLLIPSNWPDSELLRFHQSTSFNCVKTIPLLKEYVKWRGETDKIFLTERIFEILNSGFFYSYGYDCRFRPIIYLNFNNYKKNCNKYSDQEFETAIIYFIEYVIKNLLIPGQVENWVIITDKGDYSVLQIPAGIKKISSMLQNNYRARLYKGFVFGLSGFMTYLWSFVKLLLDESTSNKITLIDSSNKYLLFEQINVEQLEKQYGGEAENLKEGEYFPPKCNSDNFLLKDESSEILLTENTYTEKVMKDDRIRRSPYKKKLSIKIKPGRKYDLYLQYNNSIFTKYIMSTYKVYHDFCEKLEEEDGEGGGEGNKQETKQFPTNIHIETID